MSSSIKCAAENAKLQFQTQVLSKLFCVEAKGRRALEVEGASDECGITIFLLCTI